MQTSVPARLADVLHPRALYAQGETVATKVWIQTRLLCEHLCQNSQDNLLRCGIHAAKVLDETHPIHRAQLIEDDMSLFALELA